MAFPFNSPEHVKNSAILSHGSACSCGCAASLANNRKIKDGLLPRGFQDSVKSEVKRSTDANEDKYLTNVDALSFTGLKKPSVIMESYMLSNIVAKIEANTPFFEKGTDKAVAGNCGKRVMGANLRKKIFGEDSVSDNSQGGIDIVSVNGSVSYAGAMCCHNVWGCPVCARKVSERRKKGLSSLLTAHFDKFGADSVIASLFTVPHSLGDDAKDITQRLRKCYSDMTQSRGYKQLMKTLEGCGSSRALEVTWGTSAGFHPHIHVLNFFENSILLHHSWLADTLFSLWSQALQKNELSLPSRKAFGCNIVPSSKEGIDAVAEYFSKSESDVNDADIATYLKKHKTTVREVAGKSGWGIEHEMTKWHLKQGQGQGLNFRYSMFDLLRGYSIASANGDDESRKKFRALWLAYRDAFKGQRQLWTRHKHFKIKELELNEKELAELEPSEPAKIIFSIPFDVWLMVVYMGARGSVLEIARRSGADGVVKTLDFIRSGYDLLPEERRVLH